MRRRLREYKKEKRMWCRYVAGAMAFMMLAASAPVTSAFGLENEEEQATILTYKETDEGMAIDQFIPTEEAQASWEEGFQEAKAELEAKGYENITNASDENNMVYVGGEDYIVPVRYVKDEEKNTIPLEAYDGEGGQHYLWKCIKAEIVEKMKEEQMEQGMQEMAVQYFWVRSKDCMNTAIRDEKEVQLQVEFKQDDEEKATSENEKSSETIEKNDEKKFDLSHPNDSTKNGIEKIADIFDLESASTHNATESFGSLGAVENNNVDIQGNLVTYINPKPEKGLIQPGLTGVDKGIDLITDISCRNKISMKADWEFEYDFYSGYLYGVSENVSATGVGIRLSKNDELMGKSIVCFGEFREQINPNTSYNNLAINPYDGIAVNCEKNSTVKWKIISEEDKKTPITIRNDYDYTTDTSTVSMVEGVTGRKVCISNVKYESLFLGFRGFIVYRPNEITSAKVMGEFKSFSYDNFAPQLVNAKWYDTNGNELSKNSEILAGDEITVKTKVKNNSTEAEQFGAHLKLSDDESQVYSNGIDATGSGLDGDGTAVTLTNQEQEKTFVVKATRDITAGELALGIMMEDDFFHEKQYMQLHLGEQYGVTYDSNLSSLDPAVNADAVTVPEIARVPVGDSFTVGNVSAAQIDSTDGTTRYEFTGWNTKADGSGYPYAAGASMTPTEATTLYAQWRNATLCPLTLDVSDNSVKDKAGTLVADASTAHDGYTYDPATGAVQIDERLFGGACNAPDGHVHTLTITGTKSDAGGLVTIGTSGTSAAAYSVSVEGVTAPGMVIQSNGGSVTFNGTNLLGGGTNLNGLELDVNGGSVTLADGSAVTTYTTATDGIALKDSGKTVKSLNLTMGNQNTQDVGMRVAGVDKSLPTGTAKIAYLDKKDGTWLTTSAENMKVQNADGSADYVSGATEASYKKTFELGADGVGTYTDVRLPNKLKQISLTVPTRVVFNIYTEGKDGADHGFIGPEYELKNTSYTTEDYYKGKEFGSKTYQPVDVGFGGITAREKSQYQLADYKTADEGVLNETITDFNTKPLVCIQALGNGTEEGRVNLDESAGGASVDWFKAVAATGDGENKAGISKIKLTVPKEYTGSDSKRWYQDVEAVSKEGHVYRGYHTMKLSFTLP